jgi:hypothetical protein
LTTQEADLQVQKQFIPVNKKKLWSQLFGFEAPFSGIDVLEQYVELMKNSGDLST